jgi:hypothetical protein
MIYFVLIYISFASAMLIITKETLPNFVLLSVWLLVVNLVASRGIWGFWGVTNSQMGSRALWIQRHIRAKDNNKITGLGRLDSRLDRAFRTTPQILFGLSTAMAHGVMRGQMLR